MNEMLKHLYDALNIEIISENPFMTPELLRKKQQLMNNFRSEAEADEAAHLLSDIQEGGQQKAFSAGFYAAVKLFMK